MNVNIHDLEIEDLIKLLRSKNSGKDSISLQKLVLAGDTDDDYEAILAEIVKKIIKEDDPSVDEELPN